MVFNNKILGAVTLVVDKALDVGEGMYKTLYIEYYQANGLDDPTYVRETDYYHTDPDYKNLVKKRVWYFYTTRPTP
ncbi:MAG: hypothetical protein Q4B52_01835 [Tissierellia bacterium]|nr:hypothetical protein [Tissierellia bacterium]